ncbi:MAG: cell division protein FtsA [Verrucomicrobia bacterium GWC2_42_7]|nr:MAG: cell division protein FtsA [Verrucomicrobia bacterium GWC2_42_7]
MNSKIVGAIEIGTSKVIVLVGEIIRGNSLNIIGVSEIPSIGVKKGEMIDLKAASLVTHEAIRAAEKSSKATLDKAFLAQTGSHLMGIQNTATVKVRSADNIISASDIQRVQEEAKSKELDAQRVYVNHIRNFFKVDNKIVENPIGMEGQQLSVSYWSISGDVNRIKDSLRVINGFGLEVENMVISSVASGSIVTSETERKNGVLVIDIGCGTTDYVAYKDGVVIKTGVVPIGGDHFTNDLSLGLRVNNKHAEKLKLEVGKAVIDDSDKEEKVWLIGGRTIGDRNVKRLAIYQILNARAEELFGIIKKQLSPIEIRELSAGVVLTGGSSHLRKIDEAANNVLNADIRLAENPNWADSELRDPKYSTALGLLHYSLKTNNPHLPEEQSGLFHRLAKMLF